MAKSRKKRKGQQWVARQNRDPFVKKARQTGYRARAAFKLEQIDQKYRLIHPHSRVVDLGSAPGSWSQYTASRIGGNHQIVAVDLLPMQDISGVQFIRGDFTENAVVQQILALLDGHRIDLVLSDMAPNLTGIKATDQARAEVIQESIMGFCERALKPGGALVTKLFEGESAIIMRAQLKLLFKQFHTFKPEASRNQSKEIFLVAREYSGNKQSS